MRSTIPQPELEALIAVLEAALAAGARGDYSRGRLLLEAGRDRALLLEYLGTDWAPRYRDYWEQALAAYTRSHRCDPVFTD